MPKFSQHFLTSESAARDITGACEDYPADLVVEIGPGRGFLTRFLEGKYAGRLAAVEIDPEMVARLRSYFPGGKTIRIVQADFLDVDLASLVKEIQACGEECAGKGEDQAGGTKIKFVGNLPYSVASPILQKILAFPGFDTAVLMFQKEVAERICAKPGTTDYGVLSISAQARADINWVRLVEKDLFIPEPQVDSAVISLVRKKESLFSGPAEEGFFFKIVKAASSQRRKTILNSMSGALGWRKPACSPFWKNAGWTRACAPNVFQSPFTFPSPASSPENPSSKPLPGNP